MFPSQKANLSAAFSGDHDLFTGGLRLTGSYVARQLVDFGPHVTVIQNLVPEYGENWSNNADVKVRGTVHIGCTRDRWVSDSKNDLVLFRRIGRRFISMFTTLIHKDSQFLSGKLIPVLGQVRKTP